MTTVADHRGDSQGPEQPGSGSIRARTKRTDEGRFYTGLVALVAILVFSTLAVVALLPMIIPGYTSSAITSGSMMPKLRPGDVVIAVDQGDTPIAVGTIIVFEDPVRGDLVAHRVVGINADGTYATKGDANGVVDITPVPGEYVRGVGRWVVPYVGLPRVWLTDGRWIPLLLTIAAAVAAAWFVRYAVETRYDPWAEATATNTNAPGPDPA